MDKVEVGQVVWLNSGSPPLTVSGSTNGTPETVASYPGLIHVSYVLSDGLHTGTLPLACLRDTDPALDSNPRIIDPEPEGYPEGYRLDRKIGETTDELKKRTKAFLERIARSEEQVNADVRAHAKTILGDEFDERDWVHTAPSAGGDR